ncbi:ribonuclease P/MRP protein subunit POP5 [Diorhabda carinulata]|uniref:ribonuclease P/MRP protein subunit POP5 n=1 Tax=Diorhabda carinulata TaxID=1163345 RepID=UPI0025A17E1A|nr:ribonuclease P/MRP protein subunit POP5 [Diorhabda carinulata]
MVRHKHRYIVLEISEIGGSPTSPLKIREYSIYKSIQSHIQTQHGDFGVAATRAGFMAKYLNEHTRIAVIRCRRGSYKFVSSVIPLIRKIDEKTVVVNILYVGATIRKSFFFIRNYQQKKLDEYCVSLKTDEERNRLKEAMLNFDSIFSKL